MDNIALKHLEDQKETVLDFSREMSDLIIESHGALCKFLSKFREWKQLRRELISQFEGLEKNLKESSTKFTMYKEMLQFAKTGASFVAAAPIPEVSIIARVISVFTGLFSAFLSTTEKKTAEVDGSNDITIAVARDTSASHDLYFCGLKCGLDFENTTELIANFQSNAPDPAIFENDSPEVAAFMRGILEYRPTHRIFFKKLHKCFQKLFEYSRSEFGERFCEPFLLYSSDIINIIEFLNWRLRHDDFNLDSVRHELEQIELIVNNPDATAQELGIRIRSCIGVLQDELRFLEGCVKDLYLFEKSVQSQLFFQH